MTHKMIARINQATSRSIEILQRTAQRMNEERAAEAAASMAYYGFFSLFPLLLIAVVIVSTVLENTLNTLTEEQVLDTLLQAFPFSSDLISENIQQVLKARGSVGIIGLVGLTWAALGAFTVLMRNINRAWPNTKARNIIKIRLMSFAVLAVMLTSMISLFVFNTVTRFLPQDITLAAEKATSSQNFTEVLTFLLLFIFLFVLYWWLPRTKVRWKEAAWGALTAAIGISIVTIALTWFVESGLSNYNLVYGSLGAILGLLFWIYLLSFIIFSGAHLSAAIAYISRGQGKTEITKKD